jgi:6-phosphogluconolactonase (cycloisomerase 2 family)
MHRFPATRRPNRAVALAATAAMLAVLCALATFTTSAMAADGDFLFKQCVSESGSGGVCTDGRLLAATNDLAISPDGRHAYATSWEAGGQGALQVLDRDPLTGRITPRTSSQDCYRDAPVSADCVDVRQMVRPQDVDVSADGKHVWVTETGADGVVTFDRDVTTGRLMQKDGDVGCINVAAAEGCRPARAMVNPAEMEQSPDGSSLYVPSLTEGSIAILQIKADGHLEQVSGVDGCVTESGTDGAGGPCTDGTAMSSSFQMAVSPDGKHVYGASQITEAITLFNRDADSGALTQKSGLDGCISKNGFPDAGSTPRCRTQALLDRSRSIRITPDGRWLYALGTGSIVAFERDPSNGLLTFRSCVSESGAAPCADVKEVTPLLSGAISPDGKALVGRQSRTQLGGGADGLSFFDISDSDGSLTQRPGLSGCATKDGSSPAGPGTCQVVSTLGGDGQVSFATNLLLHYGGFTNSAAVIFDRDFGPACQSAAVSVPHNTAVPVTLPCSDPNNDTITYQITDSPRAGTLGSIDQGLARVLYNPFLDFIGQDTFKFGGIARGVASTPATITVAVQPAPPPGDTGGGVVVVAPPTGTDQDRDGFSSSQDCNDSDSTIRPNAREVPGNRVDENCDGLAPAYPVIGSGVSTRWTVKAGRFTLTQLSISRPPQGFKAKVTCRGKRCRFRTKALKGTAQRGVFNGLKSLNKSQRSFRPKQTLQVFISAPGWTTKVVRYQLKAGKIPTGVSLCLPADSSRPRKECT